MSSKTEKTVRRTVVVICLEDVPVSNRAMMWEFASQTGARHVHRVERATPGAGAGTGEVYLLDLEIRCKGANRHDLTKMVRTYLPEASYHYITD